MGRQYGLREDQWEKIKGWLPGRAGYVGVTAKDNRTFIEGVLYRYRTGIPWRALPKAYGDYRVVHLRYTRWSRRGVWQAIFEKLAEEADYEWAMIDSTIVRAHQHSTGGSFASVSIVREDSNIGNQQKMFLLCPTAGVIAEQEAIKSGLLPLPKESTPTLIQDHAAFGVENSNSNMRIPASPENKKRWKTKAIAKN